MTTAKSRYVMRDIIWGLRGTKSSYIPGCLQNNKERSLHTATLKF